MTVNVIESTTHFFFNNRLSYFRIYLKPKWLFLVTSVFTHCREYFLSIYIFRICFPEIFSSTTYQNPISYSKDPDYSKPLHPISPQTLFLWHSFQIMICLWQMNIGSCKRPFILPQCWRTTRISSCYNPCECERCKLF